MNIRHFLAIVAAAAVTAGPAQAGVIPGPTLTDPGFGWTDTGLGFTALDNSTLTSFTYQNQGGADTIVLTDGSGNILDSINTPAGNTSDTVSVNWALTAGSQYWLFQTVASNELFASYGLPLPSNADISITWSGQFAYSISDAINNVNGWSANEYWAGFNEITTGASAVPEPGSLVLLGIGIAGIAGCTRLRPKTVNAVS